jgi:hypothetical protein
MLSPVLWGTGDVPVNHRHPSTPMVCEAGAARLTYSLLHPFGLFSDMRQISAQAR